MFLGIKSLAAPGNRTCVIGVTVRCSNQLCYIPSPASSVFTTTITAAAALTAAVAVAANNRIYSNVVKSVRSAVVVKAAKPFGHESNGCANYRPIIDIYCANIASVTRAK